MLRIAMHALALIGLLGLPGCLLVAVGIAAGATYGVVKYSDNEAARDYRQAVEPTWDATLAALRESGYPVQEGVRHAASRGHVQINDLEAWVEPHTDTWTTVRIRVGTFDSTEHRRQATRVLDAIASRLGEPARGT